eukprot:JP441388.1.p2 GENE.JP441388.1~~JP441388.1.p2  ORF type:complete len:61 (-),score=4.20 JP441388.1:25-207(-)
MKETQVIMTDGLLYRRGIQEQHVSLTSHSGHCESFTASYCKQQHRLDVPVTTGFTARAYP